MFVIDQNYNELMIHTPVYVARLKPFLSNCTDRQFIIQGLTSGFWFQIENTKNLWPASRVHTSINELLEKIADEVGKGLIVGPFASPPVKKLMISPICTIPKPNS